MAFVVVAPGVEETAEGTAEEIVIANALAKARSVSGERVLGVDTAVEVEGRVLGKPESEARAWEFLGLLSGRTHHVWSGLALVDQGTERSAVGVTGVRVRALAADEIDRYVATGEWRGRAGGYAIQGRGAALVERIEGDYNTVVGLPVPELVRLAPDLLLG